MNFKVIEDYSDDFWKGGLNRLVRYWTYIKVGLDQVNNYKYVGAAIFGVYFALKLSSWKWLIIMAIISLLALFIFGRWWLYKGAKASEFVVTQRGTVLGYNQFNAQLRTIELLEEIRNEIKK